MRRRKKNKVQGGYIALLSAIIISAILMLVAASAGQNGFFTRFNILDSEFKERSLALSQACARVAILELASDRDYSGSATTTVGTEDCYIGPVSATIDQRAFKTRAYVGNAYTNLEVVLDTADLSVISWKEFANF